MGDAADDVYDAAFRAAYLDTEGESMNTATRIPSPDEVGIARPAPAKTSPVAVIDHAPRVRQAETAADDAPVKSVYPPKLIKAILAVTKAIGSVEKLGLNKDQNYTYQRWDDILARLSEILPDHGLLIVQTQTGQSLFEGESLVSITYDFIIMNDDGEVWPVPIKWSAAAKVRARTGTVDDKAITKCHTQAEKYFFVKLFKIRSIEMPDSDAGDDPVPRSAPKRPNIPSPDGPSDIAPEPNEDIRLQYLSYVDMTIKEWPGPWDALKDWWMSDAQKQNRAEYGFTQDEVNTFKGMIAARRPQDAQTVSDTPKVPPAPENAPATAVSDADSVLAEIERNYDKGIADLEAMLRKCRSKDEVNALWADTVAMAPDGLILAPDMKALMAAREQILARK